jgi:hypothetical protein
MASSAPRCALHIPMMAGTTDDGRWARCQFRCCRFCQLAGLRGERVWLSAVPRLTEDSTGSIITGEAGLAHARTNQLSVPLIILDLFFRRGGETSRAAPRAIGRGGLSVVLRPRVGGEGKGSAAGLPIVDNESSDFLCIAKTLSASRRREDERGLWPLEQRGGRKRSGCWRPAGWERDRNVPSILIRRLWVQRGGFQDKK